MAETKLTMSLDDLIAQASKKRDRKPAAPKPSGAPGPQSGPRKGLKKNRQRNAANGNGSGQQPRPKQQPQPQQQQPQQQQPQRQGQGQGGQRNRKGGVANLGVRGGQVQKRSVIEVPVKAIRAPPQPLPPQPRRQQQQQPRQPAPDGKWQHDLYQDDYAPPRRAAPAAQAAVSSAKLIITNLHHQVSEDDLLELFSTCGTVKGRAINFDYSGRSLGTGWILFETRAEAEKAKREYHGVKLDGKPMEIAFSSDPSSGPSTLTKLSSGISVQKPGAGGGGGGARTGGAGKPAGTGGQRLAAAAFRETGAASRGGRGGARNNRLRSTVVGRAQLDEELQDYMQE